MEPLRSVTLREILQAQVASGSAQSGLNAPGAGERDAEVKASAIATEPS